MHEVGVIKDLLEVMEREMKRAGGTKVTAVSLKVGALSDITAEHLRESFQIFARGTFADDAHIHVEEVPAEAECLECGRAFRPESLLIHCDGCGSFRCRLLGGREILLNSIEVADA